MKHWILAFRPEIMKEMLDTMDIAREDEGIGADSAPDFKRFPKFL